MFWNQSPRFAQEGDLVQLISPDGRKLILQLKIDQDFHTHRGVIRHQDLIGTIWGEKVTSHNGAEFILLQPTFLEIIRLLDRNTQILYPKDIGFILISMGITEGQRIIEAGTGSGVFTATLALTVGQPGKVYTYERREEMHRRARANLEMLGLIDRVEFHLQDVGLGFEEKDVDALFMDVPNAYDYLDQVKASLKPGGFFGCILPTMNQVELLLAALSNGGFAFIDVCETLLRHYKADHLHLRPVDRMVAHTGYLIFARSITATI